MKRDRWSVTDLTGQEGTEWLRRYNEALSDEKKPFAYPALKWMDLSKKDKQKVSEAETRSTQIETVSKKKQSTKKGVQKRKSGI